MVGSRLNVHLYRDSFNTPWGFRLQGGKDLNQPLVVQRVFSNSPAEGELQRGDIILSINNRDASQLTHKQAQDLIKHGGGQVQLVVNRPPPGTQFAPLSPPIVTQRPRAPSLQQPPSMPGTAPYQPKKINLSKLGGGGPEFGSDFSHIAKVDGYGQTAAQRYEPSSDKSVMLNRVQSSLDNITLSPRTPEVQPTSPFYQPQASYPYSQQTFTPTGLLLEQQRLQEQQAQDEGEAIVPVWERRRQFQGTAQPSAVRTPLSKPPPKVPKPRPGPTSYGDFGTTYGPTKKAPTNNWRPAPAFKPTPAPVSATPASYTPINVQYAPKPAPKPSPPIYAPGQSPSSWQQQPSADESTPAWRNTLKTTGVKPWEQETGYALQQEPVSTKPPPPASNQSGERDWSQSAVLRFINQEDTRGKGKNPPAVSPKPKVYSPGQSSAQPQNYYEEIGASDF